MIRRIHPLFAFAALAAVASARGQTAPPAPPPGSDATTSIFAHNPPKPVATDDSLAPPDADLHGDAPRISSSELAGALVDSLPKYDPKAKAAAAKAEAAKADAAANAAPDQPKNTIVRLPKVVVRETKPPIFTERELYTKQGLTDLAIQRYVGIDPAKAPNGTVANIERFLFQGYANQQYADNERQGAIAGANDMAAIAAASGDSGESEYIKRASNDTFLRSLDDSDAGEGNESMEHMNDDHAGWGAPVPSPH